MAWMMMRWGRLAAAALCCALAVAVAVASGCSRESAMSAEDVRDTYALRLLEGFTVGYMVIKAERVDPQTKDVYGLRIEDGQRILHAERAEILVSTEMGTVSLRLHGLVGADPETGSMIYLERVTTAPSKVRLSEGN
jgi:hypothetical protein